METTKRWTVVVDIERGTGRTRAVARLHQRHADRLVAVGRAAVDPGAPVAAVELAAADALARLGHELHRDVERIVRQLVVPRSDNAGG